MSKLRPFVGRKKELTWLKRVADSPGAKMVVVRGRRRIGKSYFVEEFAKNKCFLKFSALYPDVGIDAKTQRENFVAQLQQQLSAPKLASDDWFDLFHYLAEQTQEKELIILFDEISWMADGDPTFLPKLKLVWDEQFKKNPRVMLVLCGSISSWIEKNILASTGFLGRITEKITLMELALNEMCELMNLRGVYGSPLELLNAFALTGGVPWYIELFPSRVSILTSIKRLCFHADGILVEEFQRIFHDLFKKRTPLYREIVLAIAEKKLTQAEIADKLNYSNSAQLSDYLHDLETAGFIAKDKAWSFITGKEKRQVNFRLKDNYLRFYFRCIEPRLNKILKRDFEEEQADIPSYTSIMGLQFENLVLNNRQLIIEQLGLTRNQIFFDNPYFQRATKERKGCQIDYLIQTTTHTLYICEIKFSKSPISVEVIQELKEKIAAIDAPKYFSRIPVLIHVSGVSDALENSEYFYKIINFTEFLMAQ
jgi:AAA+ ATPase superfamily predicted ATPase